MYLHRQFYNYLQIFSIAKVINCLDIATNLHFRLAYAALKYLTMYIVYIHSNTNTIAVLYPCVYNLHSFNVNSKKPIVFN